MEKNKLYALLSLLIFWGAASNVFGQTKTVVINQDPKIERMVGIKKKIDSERYDAQYYAIQLYYGNHTAAKNIVREFEKKFPDTVTSLIFETPNYKVRVGRFKDINKANILLEEIKKTYPGAFLLEPNNL
ncbi:MAG: sporulation protein [Flavobacteriales bacterium]|nr:sporulation protein [Candidatus Arcticimaribacter sp.]|tara:strand:- start:610 stop:999 length:390 start_codon:yes stop_codon:yes gene_type:complete